MLDLIEDLSVVNKDNKKIKNNKKDSNGFLIFLIYMIIASTIFTIIILNNKKDNNNENNEYYVYYKVNIGYINEIKKKELEKDIKDLNCSKSLNIDGTNYYKCTGTIKDNKYKPGDKVKVLTYKYIDVLDENEYIYQNKWIYNDSKELNDLKFKFYEQESKELIIKYSDYKFDQGIEEELYNLYSKNHINTYNVSLTTIIETILEENPEYKDIIKKEVNEFIMPNHDVFFSTYDE